MLFEKSIASEGRFLHGSALLGEFRRPSDMRVVMTVPAFRAAFHPKVLTIDSDERI